MAKLLIDGHPFEAQLIAFDKDGTLIDLHYLWGQKTEQWVDLLLQETGRNHHLRQTIYQTLGYDSYQRRIVMDSPLAVASNPKLYAIVAGLLFRFGVSWHKAEEIVYKAAATTFNTLPTKEQIKPIGDITNKIRQLKEAGLYTAVITSDNREGTEASLALLGLTEWIDMIICGDDKIPNKPHPAALWQIGQALGIKPAQMLMVGDTSSDMLLGRNAGVGGCIGILSEQDDSLHGLADIVIPSIEAIQVPGGQ